MWIEKIRKEQERDQAALRLKEKKIEKLEEELKDLIAHIELHAVAEAPDSISTGIKGGTILPGEPDHLRHPQAAAAAATALSVTRGTESGIEICYRKLHLYK